MFTLGVLASFSIQHGGIVFRQARQLPIELSRRIELFTLPVAPYRTLIVGGTSRSGTDFSAIKYRSIDGTLVSKVRR